MKHLRFVVLCVFVLLGCVSCKKDEEFANTVYQSYWQGSVVLPYQEGAKYSSMTYNLQLYFKTGTMAVCQYTVGSVQDYYTADYCMTSSNTVVCSVQSSLGDVYDEAGTISSDGETMVYHTRILGVDDSCWKDIELTRIPLN